MFAATNAEDQKTNCLSVACVLAHKVTDSAVAVVFNYSETLILTGAPQKLSVQNPHPEQSAAAYLSCLVTRMDSAQRFEIGAANHYKDSLVDKLLQRMTGSAKYSQLGVSDEYSVRRSQDRWSPEEDATWWARLTYSYASGLIKLGYSQPLQQEHLWDMAHQHEAVPVSSKFHAALAATQDPMKTPHVYPPSKKLIAVSIM